MYLAVIVAVTLLSFASSAKTGTKVAFHAVLDINTVIKQDAVVVYKSIPINEGGGYNNVTGIFTAPRGGLYEFQIHAMAYPNKNAFLGLYQNAKLISKLYLQSGSLYTNAGKSVIVRVNKGETIFVKAFGESNLISSSTEQYTTFGGFLI